MSIITQREEDLLELNADEVFNQQWDELVKAYLGERLVNNGNEETDGNGPEI
jgi:hypothetical protein